MENKYVINGYKPEKLFRFFEDICRIPRGSGNEAGISEYIVKFAEERGLYAVRDKENNVLVRMPATERFKNATVLVLQGHVDMVCEKNNDVEHDFLTDPIVPYVDGKYLRAKGTTLGGDDGIAVAAMMTLMDGELPEHPEFEFLFTTNEEVGLTGASAFDYSKLKGRTMINMDSEEDGHVIVGCAGGIRSDISCSTDMEEIPSGYTPYKITVKGLMGGHSGENINSGRSNANKLMGRILSEVAKNTDVRIISLDGGSKDNAIPRECAVTIALEDHSKGLAVAVRISEEIRSELYPDDSKFEFTFSECEKLCCASSLFSRTLISMINIVPNGVITMSKDIEGLVEFSRNLGVIKFEDGNLNMIFSSRSANESQIDASVSQLNDLCLLGGMACKDNAAFSVKHYSRYPGWRFSQNSPLRDCYMRVYERLFGRKPEANIIHAGLECGIISSHVEDMDMISIGPDMKDIHSPDEALDLGSCERFFALLKEIILEM